MWERDAGANRSELGWIYSMPVESLQSWLIDLAPQCAAHNISHLNIHSRALGNGPPLRSPPLPPRFICSTGKTCHLPPATYPGPRTHPAVVVVLVALGVAVLARDGQTDLHPAAAPRLGASSPPVH